MKIRAKITSYTDTEGTGQQVKRLAIELEKPIQVRPVHAVGEHLPELTIEIPDPKPEVMTPGERLYREVTGDHRYADAARSLWESRAVRLGITAPPPPKVKSPGQVCYEAYVRSCGVRGYSWEELRDCDRAAWELAAQACRPGYT